MKEIKHIIFDMDGVIIDTEPEYKRRLKYFLEVKGYEVSDDLCNKTCGSSLKDAYRILKNEIKKLPLNFVEIGKSYIINLKHMRECHVSYVVMNDGKELGISRAYRNYFNEKILEYNS